MIKSKKELKTYVVYEVWTRSSVVQAANINEALEIAAPLKREMLPDDAGNSLALSNTHAVAVK